MLAAWAGRAELPKQSYVPEAFISRCGSLYIGYSCCGKVPAGRVEAVHAQQLSYVLSLWQPDPMPGFYSTGSAVVQGSTSASESMLTTLTDVSGARFEVITSKRTIAGPEFVLRGSSGALFASEGVLWFTGDENTLNKEQRVGNFPKWEGNTSQSVTESLEGQSNYHLFAKRVIAERLQTVS